MRSALMLLVVLLSACGPTEDVSAQTTQAPAMQTPTTESPTTGETTVTMAEEATPSKRGTKFSYGTEPQQFGILTVPDSVGPHPVVVLVHGGFWKASFDLDLMEPLAQDLSKRDYATWNIEYRRVGDPLGGYPGTLHDVAAAIDYVDELSAEFGLDTKQVVVVGHSSGGHLALWSGSRVTLADGRPGANPKVHPKVVVGQAAITDLIDAAETGLGGNATQVFLGGEPADAPEAYEVAQPKLSTTETILVSGSEDTIVPIEQTTRHQDQAHIIVVDGEDHFSVIDPASESWSKLVEKLNSTFQLG